MAGTQQQFFDMETEPIPVFLMVTWHRWVGMSCKHSRLINLQWHMQAMQYNV